MAAEINLKVGDRFKNIDDVKDNLKFVFSNFICMSLHDPTVIIVDKDFNEITVLKSVLCIATILLCTFHIIKFF